LKYCLFGQAEQEKKIFGIENEDLLRPTSLQLSGRTVQGLLQPLTDSRMLRIRNHGIWLLFCPPRSVKRDSKYTVEGTSKGRAHFHFDDIAELGEVVSHNTFIARTRKASDKNLLDLCANNQPMSA
jgi:hypothetical protein